jgi:hypothetical protein
MPHKILFDEIEKDAEKYGMNKLLVNTRNNYMTHDLAMRFKEIGEAIITSFDPRLKLLKPKNNFSFVPS